MTIYTLYRNRTEYESVRDGVTTSTVIQDIGVDIVGGYLEVFETNEGQPTGRSFRAKVEATAKRIPGLEDGYEVVYFKVDRSSIIHPLPPPTGDLVWGAIEYRKDL